MNKPYLTMQELRFYIFFTTTDGETDSFYIEGDSMGQVREKAAKEVSKRGGKDAWSQQI